MNKVVKVLSVFLSALIMLQASIPAMAATKLKSKYTGLTYTHQNKFDGYDVSYGIDISQHNGNINFNKVVADGIDYVFVRVGYTGYTKSKFSLNYDKKYKEYIEDAVAAGLDVGVYWYSQAVTTAEAVQEANKLLKAISSYDITMPVVFDYEFADTKSGRLDSAKLSKDRMTANALAFLDTVHSAGYEACIYASENFYKEHLYYDDISSLYTVWLANYSTKTSYDGDFEYWQHTSRGRVSGISGNVDINFRYVDDVTELPAQSYTAREIQPQPDVDFDLGTVLTKDVDYTLSYTDNVEVGTAEITAKGIGAYSGYSQSFRFDIIPATVDTLTFVSSSETSLKYTWTAPTGTSKFRLYVKNNTTGKTFTKTVNENSATLSNLTNGNSYTVKVAAGRRNADGNVVWGVCSAGDTRVTQGDRVSGPRVKSSSASAIRLAWNKFDGSEMYIVYIYNDDSEEYEEIARVLPDKLSYKVDGLDSGETYKFKVSAVVNGVEGKKSKYLKTAVKPERVKNKSAKSTSKRRITVKWSYTECTGYQVQWSTKKSFSSNTKSVYVNSWSKVSKTIKTARSKTRYYVRVRPYTKAGGKKIYGKWSSTKSVYVK